MAPATRAVSGTTNSTGPATAGAYQTSNLGTENAFVTKLNAAGSAMVYSTCLGGSGVDLAAAIAIDSGGNAYVTGSTISANFPVTQNSFQVTRRGPQSAFVTKLNAAGNGLVFSTYLGGTGSDRGASIAVDTSGNTYVTGAAGSSDFPTSNPVQAANAGG